MVLRHNHHCDHQILISAKGHESHYAQWISNQKQPPASLLFADVAGMAHGDAYRMAEPRVVRVSKDLGGRSTWKDRSIEKFTIRQF